MLDPDSRNRLHATARNAIADAYPSIRARLGFTVLHEETGADGDPVVRIDGMGRDGSESDPANVIVRVYLEPSGYVIGVYTPDEVRP
jgi:hypothetical protein